MFYEKLKKILKEQNLTLNKLAKGCNIAQSPTSRWKTGTMPSADALIKICKYLQVSADYLLDLEDADPPPILAEDEKLLISHYRECDSGTKKSIQLLASSGAAIQKEKETSLDSKIG